MTPAPLPESYWVHDQLLAGPYPGDSTTQLVEAGITAFVDLTTARELPPYETSLPSGITYRRMPIQDFSIPSEELMTAILEELDRRMAEGRRIYLHCYAGRGRTGTVVGCHLALRGFPGEAALEQLQRLRESAGCSPQARSPETELQRTLVRAWPLARQ
jgi:hypothetical protein